MKRFVLTITLLLGITGLFAQSPLTGIDFYKAYLDVPIVKKASIANGLMSEEMMDYIFKKSNPAEVKYAIVNALGYKGKAAINRHTNDDICANYLKDHFNISSNEMLLKTFGVSTAMSLFYFIAVLDTVKLSTSLSALPDIHEANLKQYPKSRFTEIIISLIKAQSIFNEMPQWETPQEGEHISLVDFDWYNQQQEFTEARATDGVKKICVFNRDGYYDDVRSNVIDIIWNYMKPYSHEISIIKIVSLSYNPYSLKINGELVKTRRSRESWEYLCKPGYYHIEAVQQSGYVFSPTVNRRDVNITDGETIEVKIGY